ncbi:MAG: VWA domain-containing protein [Anaerolineales bacterium]|nr:VWA domain-containing protein [Anaerolineales bacterium]
MNNKFVFIIILLAFLFFLFPLLLHAAQQDDRYRLPTPLIEPLGEADGQMQFQTLIGPLYTEEPLGDTGFKQRQLDPALTINAAALLDADGKTTPLASAPVTPTTETSHFLLLLDTSGTMQPALGKLPQTAPANSEPALLYPAGTAKGVAQGIVDFLEDQGLPTQLAVWSFNDDLQTQITFTNDKQRVRNAIGSTPWEGGETCLYDAVTTAVTALETATATNHRGGLLLFTDGRDELKSGLANPCSQKATLAEAIRVAQKAFIPVHVFLFTGSQGQRQEEMQTLANATGGQFVSSTPYANERQLKPLLDSLTQWRFTGSLYTLRGPHAAKLRLTLSSGEVITRDVVFNAPRDFPQPAKLTYIEEENKECQVGTPCVFTYTLDDPHQQISHLTVQAKLEDGNPVVGVPLTAGYDDHIPRPTTEAFTLELLPSDNLFTEPAYELALVAIPTNPNQDLVSDSTATFSLTKPPPPLEIRFLEQETTTTTTALCDPQATSTPSGSSQDSRDSFKAALANLTQKACNLFSSQAPVAKPITQLDDTTFKLQIEITNGLMYTETWKTVDVYVWQRRWRWFRFQEEGYEYPCSLAQPADGNSENAEAGSCTVMVDSNWATGTITVPHRLEPRTTWVTLQARDGERRPLMPPTSLPFLREANALGRLAEAIANFWQDWGVWLGFLLLALGAFLVWRIITIWLQASRDQGDDIKDVDLRQFTEVILTVFSSPDTTVLNKRLTLGDSIISIGRENCTLNIPADGYLSRHHAEISLERDGYAIKDLGSDSGTYIRIQNSEPLRVSTTRPTLLNTKLGSEIRVGDTILRIEAKPVG